MNPVNLQIERAIGYRLDNRGRLPISPDIVHGAGARAIIFTAAVVIAGLMRPFKDLILFQITEIGIHSSSMNMNRKKGRM